MVDSGCLQITFSEIKTGRRDADRRVFLPSASFGMRSRAVRSALACRRPTTALAAANERHRSAPETFFLGRGEEAGVTRPRLSHSSGMAADRS